MPTKSKLKPDNNQGMLKLAIETLRKHRKKVNSEENIGTTSNSKLYIPSQDLAEYTVEFLEYCINQICSHQPPILLEDAYNLVKAKSEILIQAASTVLSDDAGISKSIIKNSSLRVLKLIKDIIERNNHGIDEGSYEVYYNKTCANYQNFFGDAIEKMNYLDDDECSSGDDNDDGQNGGNGKTTTQISRSKKRTLEESYESLKEEMTSLKEDIQGTINIIETKALEQIEGGDVILTVGYCNTLAAIFKRASEKYQTDPIHIVVCQGPNNKGEKMARLLKKSACDVSFITDSSMYVALQQGVDKVILGAKLILGDGSCVVASGTHTLAAICAKQRNIPVMVAAGTHKFSAIFPGDTITLHGNVANTLSHIKLENKNLKHSYTNNVISRTKFNPCFKNSLKLPEINDVIDPKSDLINNENIDLLLVNDVAHTPGFVYRKLNEMYPLEEIHNV